jgi:hypothetical protein
MIFYYFLFLDSSLLNFYRNNHISIQNKGKQLLFYGLILILKLENPCVTDNKTIICRFFIVIFKIRS